MKAKEMIYLNEMCTAHRVDVYVKRGAYSHGYVKGWELRNAAGTVVVDPHPLHLASAYEYQSARFSTLTVLKSWVDDQNKHAARRAARSAP